MKKTTLLLIGALAFVLQQASAGSVAYSEDLENNSPGDGVPGWWTWIGGESVASTYTVQPYGGSGLAAVANWDSTGSTWQGYSSGPNGPYPTGPWGGAASYINNVGDMFDGTYAAARSDWYMTIDLADIQNVVTNPVTIWIMQYTGATETWEASYTPIMNTEPGAFTTVAFSFGDPSVITKSGTYDPSMPIKINIDDNGGWTTYGPGNEAIWDNLAIYEVPEPGTIALITLGGLGALVAIRRRQA
jgi:hypothetical protein